MTKEHPQLVEGEKSLMRVRDLEEFVSEVIGRQKDVDADRARFVQKLADFHERRYLLQREVVSFPWPDAASVKMPLIDMIVDRVKPNYVNLVFGATPMVSFDPQTSDDVARARKAEQFMDWLLRTGMRGFFDEVVTGIDMMLEKGYVVFKTIWDYRTEMVAAPVLKEDLTPQLLRWLALPDATPGQVEEIEERIVEESLATGMSMVETATLLVPTLPATREEKESILAQLYGLDEKDADDRKALDELLEFFRGDKDKTVIRKREVLRDSPHVCAVAPEDIIVDENVSDLQDAEHITHRMFFTENQLRMRARDMGYANVEAALEAKINNVTGTSRLTHIKNLQAYREGTTGDIPDGAIEVWENYCYYDWNGDGIKERVVLTVEPRTKTVLKFTAFPYDHGRWPFAQACFEKNQKRFNAARGIPEKLDDIDREITAQHRAKLNEMQLLLAPMFKYRLGASFNPNNVRFIPGQFVPVINMDDFAPVEMPISKAQFFQQEENVLRTWAEQYIGAMDLALTNPLSSLTEARTAREIDAISAISAQNFGLRGQIFQDAMKEVYEQVWGLWLQYGPRKVWIRTTKETPVLLTRREIQGRFNLRPTGTIGNTNPALQAAKALGRLQLLLPLTADVLGVKYELDKGELIRDYLEKDDVRLADRIVRQRSAQEVQAIVNQQAQMMQLQQAQETEKITGAREQRQISALNAMKGLVKPGGNGDRGE